MDIALQLYSIKEEVDADYDAALAMTKAAGYTSVELHTYQDYTPHALLQLLDKHQLKAISAHIGIDRFRGNFDAELAFAKALGLRMMICPWCDCKSREEIEADAAVLQACAKKAAGEDIFVGYHNHAQEFEKFDGQYALELLFDQAPDVAFEPDLFWIAYAGLDPIAYIAPFVQDGKVCAVHAKEIAKEGTANVYIGQGRIDFAAAARLCPPEAYPFIVEQEEFTSSHEDGIRQSYLGLLRALRA